jgi:phosphoserine phosphatase
VKKLHYASVILDVDSTLCGIEGIDWIAKRRSAELAASIASVTERAMNGEIPIAAIYGERMSVVRPNGKELKALADAYRENLAPGAEKAIKKMRKAGVRLHLISGGFTNSIWPVAEKLGFSASEVHAVDVTLDSRGEYVGYETDSPMTRDGGKLEVVRDLHLPRPSLAVGDGNTDLAMKPAVDTFAAYVGFMTRDAVVDGAHCTLRTFDELLAHVLSL